MDTGSRAELLAANLTVDEIQRYLEVDSLSYLSIDRLLEATGATGAGFCNACLTGDYPVEIPADLAEGMFEAIGKVKDLERPGTPVSVGYGHELPTEDAPRLFPRA
jgi:amidophosphoribosyltransferase